MKRYLLMGCGREHSRRLGWISIGDDVTWADGFLVKQDHNPTVGADVVSDLEEGLPFRDESFDEVHAYEVLEHLGRQGDWRSFFRDFGEIHRVLKPGGLLCATTPLWNSFWAWSDPSHTRIISRGSLVFLSQQAYIEAEQKARSTTDFRFIWTKDFKPLHLDDDEKHGQFSFILQKQ